MYEAETPTWGMKPSAAWVHPPGVNLHALVKIGLVVRDSYSECSMLINWRGGPFEHGQLQGLFGFRPGSEHNRFLLAPKWDNKTGLLKGLFCRVWFSSRNLPILRRTHDIEHFSEAELLNRRGILFNRRLASPFLWQPM